MGSVPDPVLVDPERPLESAGTAGAAGGTAGAAGGGVTLCVKRPNEDEDDALVVKPRPPTAGYRSGYVPDLAPLAALGTLRLRDRLRRRGAALGTPVSMG